MWPLSLFFLFATSGLQQPDSGAILDFHGKLPAMQMQRRPKLDRRFEQKLDASLSRNMCFTVRSYVFHRQDGQAPVLAGTTTCTPANVLRQLQVSPEPQVKLVPADDQREQGKK